VTSPPGGVQPPSGPCCARSGGPREQLAADRAALRRAAVGADVRANGDAPPLQEERLLGLPKKRGIPVTKLYSPYFGEISDPWTPERQANLTRHSSAECRMHEKRATKYLLFRRSRKRSRSLSKPLDYSFHLDCLPFASPRRPQTPCIQRPRNAAQGSNARRFDLLDER
jgi:hypothetical protein